MWGKDLRTQEKDVLSSPQPFSLTLNHTTNSQINILPQWGERGMSGYESLFLHRTQVQFAVPTWWLYLGSR